MQKIDMSIAIICMVKEIPENNTTRFSESYEIFLKNNDASYNDNENITCLFQPKNGTNSSSDGEFTWSKSVQGLILSSYFYGYMITQVT